MKHGANGTSSENEEEKHNELVCRPGTFRMITSSNAIVQSLQQIPSLPETESNNLKKTTKLKLETQQQKQNEEINIRQQDAQKQILKLQAEARARAEAARAEQVQLYQKKLQQDQFQKENTLKQMTEQEKINKLAEVKTQQLKTKKEAADKQAIEKLQKKTINKQAEKKVQLQKTQLKNVSNKPVVQPKPQIKQSQQNNQTNNQNNYSHQKITTNNLEQLNKNNQQQKQQTNQKSILSENKQEKTNQNGVPLSIFQPLVLNHYSRMTFSQDENQPLPKHQTNDDSSWQLQHRVPLEEIQEINPERIKIPEFFELNDVKPTVIIPTPAQTTRIQWNEFLEEEKKDRVEVPRICLQNWLPENNIEHIIQKTNYQPSHITRVWPPPGYNIEEEHEIGHAIVTKAISDNDWIQQNENVDYENKNFGGNAPWKKQLIESCEIRNRIWPPIENHIETDVISSGLKLNAQWPPIELEKKEQQDVQVLQTHLPIKPQQRKWPPVAAQ